MYRISDAGASHTAKNRPSLFARIREIKIRQRFQYHLKLSKNSWVVLGSIAVEIIQA